MDNAILELFLEWLIMNEYNLSTIKKLEQVKEIVKKFEYFYLNYYLPNLFGKIKNDE